MLYNSQLDRVVKRAKHAFKLGVDKCFSKLLFQLHLPSRDALRITKWEGELFGAVLKLLEGQYGTPVSLH